MPLKIRAATSSSPVDSDGGTYFRVCNVSALDRLLQIVDQPILVHAESSFLAYTLPAVARRGFRV